MAGSPSPEASAGRRVQGSTPAAATPCRPMRSRSAPAGGSPRCSAWEAAARSPSAPMRSSNRSPPVTTTSTMRSTTCRVPGTAAPAQWATPSAPSTRSTDPSRHPACCRRTGRGATVQRRPGACWASHCWWARITASPARWYHRCGPVLSSTPCVLRSEATGTTVPSRSHSSTASPGSCICGTTTRCTCSHGTKPRAPNIVDQDTPRSSSRAQARRASRNSVIPAAITRSPRSTTSTALTTSLRTSSATEYSAVKNPMNTSTAPAHISPELDPARTVVDPISIPPRGVVGSALGARLLDGRLAELDVPGEDLLARAGGQLELLDPAPCRQSRGGGLQVCQLGLRRLDGDGEERGLLRDLRVGLDAAQHDRRLRDRVHQSGVLALGGLAQRRGDGPRLGVHGAAAPPRPHLL